MNRIEHQNWIILLSPSRECWQFHAASPEQSVLTDGCIYAELEIAQEAARSFVNSAIARDRLNNMFDAFKDSGKLTGQDLAQINLLFGEFVKAEREFRSAIAPLRLQRLPETLDPPTT